MAGQVIAFLANDLTDPLLDPGVIDGVVVHPAFIAGVVGRIDVDAVDFAFVARQECFERFEVVAVDDHVLGAVVRFVLTVLVEGVLAVEDAVWHVEVVGDDFVFAHPVQFRHWRSSLTG